MEHNEARPAIQTGLSTDSDCCVFPHKIFWIRFFFRARKNSPERIVTKSSVAKHYGFKRVKQCGLIANGHSQANRDFSCEMYCCLAHCAAPVTLLTLSIPSSKSTFSQSFLEKCISEVVRTGTRIIFQSEYAMKSQVLHTVWCNMTGEATGEIWTWSALLGVKVLTFGFVSRVLPLYRSFESAPKRRQSPNPEPAVHVGWCQQLHG